MTPALVVLGLIAMAGQVLLLRELSVAFYGVELAYLLGLGLWLLATAVGAMVGIRRIAPSPAGIAILLVAYALLLPAEMTFLRAARRLLGVAPGVDLPFDRGVLVLILGLAPAAFLVGVLFQWIAKLFVVNDRTFAAAYALESMGSVLGGALTTLALRHEMSAVTLTLACSTSALLPCWFSLRAQKRSGLAIQTAAFIGTATCLALFASARELDRLMTRWNHPALVESCDSPYARITFARRAEQTAVFINDALVHETQETEAEAFVHVALLQQQAPAKVVILGGSTFGLLRETLRHKPSQVLAIEIDRTLLDMALRHLPYQREYPNAQTIVTDPRRFLAGEDRIDLILVGMPDPDSGQSNRFYTREFFELCAQRLAPSGVLALRLHASENYWPPLLARRMRSIEGALRDAFADVVFLPGNPSVVLASRTRVERNSEPLVARLRERRIESHLVTAPYLTYVYRKDRLREIEERLRAVTTTANSDVRPICYTYAAVLWLSRFFPRLAYMELPWETQAGLRPPSSPRDAATMALVLGVLLYARRRPALRRALLSAVAGFSGTILESVLVLHYQAERGALFQDLGVLLTGFMAGLALGSGGYRRLSRTRDGQPAHERLMGAAILIVFALLAAAVAAETTTGRLAGLIGITAIQTVCGLCVGAIVAHASQAGAPEQRRVVSPVYAADLLGGCIGALAGSLILIPLLGLPLASLLTAALLVIVILLV